MTSGNPPVPFADDPFRGKPLSVFREDVEALNGHNFLSTRLIDFVLQRGLPNDLPAQVLITSSNSMPYFQGMNKIQAESKSFRATREKYLYYGYGLYHLISVCCTKGHFFLVSLFFNLDCTQIFDRVWVFDSLKDATFNNRIPVSFSNADMIRNQVEGKQGIVEHVHSHSQLTVNSSSSLFCSYK
jgi:hypothetical protein